MNLKTLSNKTISYLIKPCYCLTNTESTAMLIDANNMLSKVTAGVTLVGCAVRTVIYMLTMVMVRAAHPTIKIYLY